MPKQKDITKIKDITKVPVIPKSHKSINFVKTKEKIILDALIKCDWRLSAAGRVVGLTRQTMRIWVDYFEREGLVVLRHPYGPTDWRNVDKGKDIQADDLIEGDDIVTSAPPGFL